MFIFPAPNYCKMRRSVHSPHAMTVCDTGQRVPHHQRPPIRGAPPFRRGGGWRFGVRRVVAGWLRGMRPGPCRRRAFGTAREQSGFASPFGSSTRAAANGNHRTTGALGQGQGRQRQKGQGASRGGGGQAEPSTCAGPHVCGTHTEVIGPWGTLGDWLLMPLLCALCEGGPTNAAPLLPQYRRGETGSRV